MIEGAEYLRKQAEALVKQADATDELEKFCEEEIEIEVAGDWLYVRSVGTFNLYTLIAVVVVRGFIARFYTRDAGVQDFWPQKEFDTKEDADKFVERVYKAIRASVRAREDGEEYGVSTGEPQGHMFAPIIGKTLPVPPIIGQPEPEGVRS